MNASRSWRQFALVPFCLAALAGPVHAAGLTESLFGKPDAPKPNAKQRAWYVREFTTLKLVPREAGAELNQHPASIQPDALRQKLALLRKADSSLLFDSDELDELIVPIAQALSNAKPEDDLEIVSSARREGILGPPKAVTARAFVSGGALNLIVNQTEYDFVVAYRSANTAPNFVYGSRSKPSTIAKLQGRGLTLRRPDWLVVPVSSLQEPTAPGAALASEPAPAAAVVAAPANAVPPPAVATQPAAATAPVLAAPVAVPTYQGKPVSAEERLETIKRLRDRGLISPEEYEQKRKEIMLSL